MFPSLPLLPAAVGALLGLLLAPPGGGVASLGLVLALGSRRLAPWALALGFFGLGAWRAEPPWTPPEGAVVARVRVEAEGEGTLLGWRQRDATEAERLRVRLLGPVTAAPGAELVALGRLGLRRGRPELRVRRATHVATATPGAWSAWGRGLRAVRRRVGATIDRGAPGRCNALFRALALGDRRGLDDGTREAFARTGTAHLLAISGLHVGLVGVGVAAAVRRPLRAAWAEAGALAGHPDVAATAVGGLAAAGYVVVAGAPVSGQRALVMLTLAGASQALGRRAAVGNALLAAALLVAWGDPRAVREPGLLLSVASVAGLLAVAPAVAAVRGPRSWRWLAGAVLVSAAATAATAPLCLVFFGRVGLAGLWANPAVVPLLGAGTLPLLLGGAALGVLSPALGAPLVAAATVPATAGVELIEWFAQPGRAPQVRGAWPPSAAFGAYAVALAAWAWGAKR